MDLIKSKQTLERILENIIELTLLKTIEECMYTQPNICHLLTIHS